MDTVNERIKFLCQMYSSGKASHFAQLMGWSYQYTYKLLTTDTCGLTPVTELVKKFPRLNARWLITGEGNPFPDLVQTACSRLELMLRYEKYIKVMTNEQLETYADAPERFTVQDIAKLDKKLQDSDKELTEMLARTKAKMSSACKKPAN